MLFLGDTGPIIRNDEPGESRRPLGLDTGLHPHASSSAAVPQRVVEQVANHDSQIVDVPMHGRMTRVDLDELPAALRHQLELIGHHGDDDGEVDIRRTRSAGTGVHSRGVEQLLSEPGCTIDSSDQVSECDFRLIGIRGVLKHLCLRQQCG
jgi:hypothetical protein